MPGSKHRETPVPYFKHSKCCSVRDVLVIFLYLFVTLTQGIGRPGQNASNQGLDHCSRMPILELEIQSFLKPNQTVGPKSCISADITVRKIGPWWIFSVFFTIQKTRFGFFHAPKIAGRPHRIPSPWSLCLRAVKSLDVVPRQPGIGEPVGDPRWLKIRGL